MKQRTRKKLKRIGKFLVKYLQHTFRFPPITVASIFIALFCVNWVYHAWRKPAEVVGLADKWFYKTPAATWQAYGSLFKVHATEICTPTFLAALAQSESSGNPIARTMWRWRFGANPFRWYAPATSATGLYQITDGTFEQTKNYCVHRGKVVERGNWYNVSSCWNNETYNRLWPSHAIEMTSAYLQHSTHRLLRHYGKTNWPLQKKQETAALIHLCGEGSAKKFVKANGRSSALGMCGAHSASSYLKRLKTFEKNFEFLSRDA